MYTEDEEKQIREDLIDQYGPEFKAWLNHDPAYWRYLTDPDELVAHFEDSYQGSFSSFGAFAKRLEQDTPNKYRDYIDWDKYAEDELSHDYYHVPHDEPLDKKSSITVERLLVFRNI